MKRLFNGHVLLLMLLFTGFSVSSQEERENQNNQDDSLEVIVPTQEYANLKMLTPPEGFEISDAFNGYLSLQTSSGIIMTMIRNAVYLRIAEGMNDEFYAKNQLTYISDTTIVTDAGYKGRVYKLKYTQKDNEFIRYMVYIGDLKDTLWLNITYPKMMEELVEDEILRSLKSVTLKPE